MIQFDLHIHSVASKYKEGKAIVDDSTPENAGYLLEKLNKHDVALFSITDHNRFNVELYCKLDELMRVEGDKYPSVQGLVAGVEFDVRIDDDMGRCHIITIFDARSDVENYKKIVAAINNNLITDKQEAYTRRDYEAILKEIGLNVILIACQRSGLDRQDGCHNSLSESVRNPEDLIRTGYIDALEFQKPNVEGILRNNLRDMPTQVGLLMGSDCHEWAEYPDHDKNSRNKFFTHSRASILPTFKGLLMAFTSPETRINRQENRNPHYLEEMRINGSTIPLVNGLNVIIGENGAGKSTLLKLLKGSPKERYVKEIILKNSMSCSTIDNSYVQYLGQGTIVQKFSEKSLFPDDNFQDVDHSKFTEAYRKYAEDIRKYINSRIDAKEALDLLENINIGYDNILQNTNYYINVKIEANYENVDNPHSAPERNFKKILDDVKRLSEQPYYEEYTDDLEQMLDAAERIYCKIHGKNEEKITESETKNAIISACNEYYVKVHEAASSRENDKRDFEKKRQEFVD